MYFLHALKLLTFLYINRRMYRLCTNFRLLVFDGFPRFRMSRTQFVYLIKICICLSICVSIKKKKKCKSSSRSLPQNFIKIYIKLYLNINLSINFYRKSLDKWRPSHTFSNIFGTCMGFYTFL